MQKYCYNTYLTVPEINKKTCGFADFLRGCCALLNFCERYNYKLLINNKSHILFKFFEYNSVIMGEPEIDLLELRSPESFDIIDKKLDNLFKSNQSFNVFTNALYKNNIDIDVLDTKIKLYIKNLLTPNILLERYFNDIVDRISLDIKKEYIIIHFRIGDGLINLLLTNKEIIFSIVDNIKEIIELNKNKQILLLSNSKIVRDQISKLVPDILYSVSDPIHLGVYESDERKIAETLSDLLLLTRCNMIYSLGYSGFSYLLSKIYDIDYKIIILMENNFNYKNVKKEFEYNYFANMSLINVLRRRIR